MGEQDLSAISFGDTLTGIVDLSLVESNPSTPGVMDAKPANGSSGESWTYTYNYQATQADVNRGYIVNTASASSDKTDKIESSVTINAVQTGTLTVKKEVVGPMFDATLKFPIAVTINSVTTNILLANGETADFSNLPYGSSYAVAETAPAGYTPAYTNGTGTITGATVLATVTNSYAAAGTYDVDAGLDPSKVLAGRTLADQEFAFVLKQGTSVLQTVNNTADGNIPFLPLSYTQADIGQTYDYTITETAGTEAGMTYDPMVLAFSVTVSDLGGGLLGAVLAAQPADTVFNNSAPLTRYRIYYHYRMSPDDTFVINTDYNYLSPLVAAGTQAGGFADRSENGFWQLVGLDGNRRTLVINEAENIVNVYYQRIQVPLGGGAVINVGDASE